MIKNVKKTVLLLVTGFQFLFILCAENLYDLSYIITPEEIFEKGKGYFFKEDYGSAQIVFQQLTRLNTVAEYSDSAQYLLGESYFFQRDYLLAKSEFDRLITNLPRSDLLMNAKYKSALCLYELSPKQKYDQNFTREAIATFEEFLADPRSESDAEILIEVNNRLFDLNEKLAAKDLQSARLYRKMQEYESAIFYLEDAMTAYNKFGFVNIIPEALFEKGECYISSENFENARESFQAIVDNFPDNALVLKAKDRLVLLETTIARADTSTFE
jgi:outer membrane protein assembly factor BamD